MMATQSDIREAVRECLTGCLAADMPLSAIAAYNRYLQSQNWRAEDIHTVESIVIKILSKLTECSEEASEVQADRSQMDH